MTQAGSTTPSKRDVKFAGPDTPQRRAASTPPIWRRLGWMAALWLAGSGSMLLLSALIRWAIQGP